MRQRLVRYAVGCLFLVGMLGSAGGAVASELQSKPADRHAAAVYRRSLGLDTTEKTISAAARQEPRVVSDTTRAFGTPLLPAEVELLKRRDLLAVQAHNGLAGWLRSYGTKQFAGEYIDNVRNRYVVLVTDQTTAAALESAVRLILADPASLEVRLVETSLTALNDGIDRLTKQLATLRGRGVDIAAVSLNVVSNRVDVSLAAPSNAAPALITATLGTVPFVIRVTGLNTFRERKTDVLDAPPVRGGQSIRTLFQGTDGSVWVRYCSTAFVGYNQTGGTYLSNVVEYYALTAGHCGPVNEVWSQASYALGTASQSTFNESAPAGDAMIIRLKYGDGSNQVFETYSNGSRSYGYIYSAADYGQANVDVVGARVCHAGATTTFQCGTIASTNATVVYASDPASGRPQTTLTGMRQANDLYSEGGDSGGSIISAGTVAEGVLSGGAILDPYVTYWTHVRNAMSAVGLQSLKTTFVTQYP